MSLSHHNVVFGLGSNLGGRLRNLLEAAEKLVYSGFYIENRSNVFETEPWGVADQPFFLNACVRAKIDIKISPAKILETIKRIESDMGRVESTRYGPRIIDIDLLLMDSIIYEDELLSVPHKEIFNRAFVLHPLFEVFPDWTHPITGESVNEAVKKYSRPIRIIKL
jgi:2-amino-4-hydroxy-6-hydroxymethyldihydropteridine diphosphokinase